jgi:hypothetical protein
LRAAAADAQSATALCRTLLLLLLLLELWLDALQLAILASNLLAVFSTGQLPAGLLCVAAAAGWAWALTSPIDCLRVMCEMLRALCAGVGPVAALLVRLARAAILAAVRSTGYPAVGFAAAAAAAAAAGLGAPAALLLSVVPTVGNAILQLLSLLLLLFAVTLAVLLMLLLLKLLLALLMLLQFASGVASVGLLLCIGDSAEQLTAGMLLLLPADVLL